MIAVEIIFPSERPGKIRQTLHEYLGHGVQQEWQVFPDTQELVVHKADHTSCTYVMGDTVQDDELLPEFSLEVAQLFKEQ